MIDRIMPSWAPPANVRAWTSTRSGGVSKSPWASLNLAVHVDDNEEHVRDNRNRMRQHWRLPAEPVWLQQVHGVDVVEIDSTRDSVSALRADASFTRETGCVCAVLTADCLPVFFTNLDGTTVGVAHAGWRGLADGVLEATVAALGVKPQTVMAGFGPAIGFDAYEVGPEVIAALGIDSADRRICQPSVRHGHAYISLAEIAASRLRAIGVIVEDGGHPCTLRDQRRWFSHRRDGNTGRMASLIFMNETTKL